ncbi:hypothetical protein [Methylotenera sp.]|uniref:hypothetical protein n=1 Tax=Methylotenera sp. TaxID=2051956 RepID=UPI002EDB0DAC
MITPIILLTAMRKNIKQADVMFTQGKCYQLYLMLSDLYPQAVAWYDPVIGHVFTEIDGKYYDINGEHESLPERSHLFDENLLSSLKNAREWDYQPTLTELV